MLRPAADPRPHGFGRPLKSLRVAEEPLEGVEVTKRGRPNWLCTCTDHAYHGRRSVLPARSLPLRRVASCVAGDLEEGGRYQANKAQLAVQWASSVSVHAHRVF